MSYGTNLQEMFWRATVSIPKILKGAKPADLPIQRPTTLELVINLTTAKVLGLTIPPSLMLRAAQVIEIYGAFLPLLTSRRVELLDHPGLAAEFLALDRRVARGGRESIDHPERGTTTWPMPRREPPWGPPHALACSFSPGPPEAASRTARTAGPVEGARSRRLDQEP